MASLSNINGLFDVHSTGAILFSTSHGTSGQILRSNGNAAPTWVAASTVIGGPYLPLTGGTLTGATATATGISFTVGGALSGTSATFTGIITATGGTSTEWNTSYDNSITALAVTGTTTKTLTATQQDGGTLTASWTDDNTGTVTSSATTSYIPYMSTATNVANSQLLYDTTNSRTILTATVGPNDDIRGSFLVRDDTAMAANVGGQIALGYKYYTSGGYTEGALIRTYKENAVDGEYGSGLKIQVRNHGASLGTKLTLNPSGHLTVSGNVTGAIIVGTGGTSTEWNTSYDNSITGLAVTGTTTKTLTATQQDGGTLTASWTDNDSNTSWPNVGAGIRTNYDLGIKPPVNSYAGFYFQTETGGNAGYFLIRGGGASGAYTDQGISLIADAGWLSLVSRTTTDKGVRIMAGATSTTRLIVTSAGNVGIGTAFTPGAQLHNYSTATTNVFITGYGTAAQNDWGAQNAMFVKTDNGLLISKQNANNNTNRLFNFYNDSNGYAQLYMYTGGNTPQVQIKTSGYSYFNGGNIGIGVTGPLSKLQIIANQSAADPGSKNYTGSAINTDGGDIAAGRVFFQGSSSGATDVCGINNETNRIVLYNYTDTRYLQYWDHAGSSFIPNGNLGVGTTVNGTRNEKLYVDGEVRQESPTGAGDNVRGGLGAYDTTTGNGAGVGGQLVLGYRYSGSSYTEGAIIKMYKENSAVGQYGSGLRFQVRNHGYNLSTKMTLDPSGNVGIGTTSPGYKLDVVGNARFSGFLEMATGGAVYQGSKFYLDGGGDTFLESPSSNIMTFTTNGTQKMRIDQNGNVIIGTETSTSCTLKVSSTKNGSASSPHFCLTGNGYTALHWLDTVAYYIQTNSVGREIRMSANTGGVKLTVNATAWASNSDIALKENIKPLENVLDKIKDYRCVEYNLKESPEDKKIGFIAQDWVDDFPVIVNKDENDMLGMKYTETIPVLLKAIQELTARVKELENK